MHIVDCLLYSACCVVHVAYGAVPSDVACCPLPIVFLVVESSHYMFSSPQFKYGVAVAFESAEAYISAEKQGGTQNPRQFDPDAFVVSGNGDPEHFGPV